MLLASDPKAQYLTYKAEIDVAIARVLRKGGYILGEEVESFEREFAAYLGVHHAVGVGNGTDALRLALSACGVGAGDEVITVSHTAVATVAAIEAAGAVPVLVDIEPASYTLDVAKLEAAITPKTRAVVPVHLYGQPADLGPILAVARAAGIKVVEDCAQATGAEYQGKKVGGWGDAGAFSFYPTKNLGALGDGGAVVTQDPEVGRKVRLLREYGWAQRGISLIPGGNSRLDALQAAVLRVKLKGLDRDNHRRAGLARRYQERLGATCLTLPAPREGAFHVHHLYVVRAPRRDDLQAFLQDEDIGALVHYPVPIHRQPAYVDRLKGGIELLQTDRAAREVLTLPLYPELRESDLDRVTDVVKRFYA